MAEMSHPAMPAMPAKPAAPTGAERARTMLAAAGSVALTTTAVDHRLDQVVVHTVDAASRLVLLDPADDLLTAELAAASHAGLAAYVEVTDVAPVAVRDRVRARLTLSGRLTAAGPGTLVFRPAQAAISEDDKVRTLDAAALAAAAPDPLAAHEAEILCHLDTGHADFLVELAELRHPRALSGVEYVRPVLLDRKGIVLRLEKRDAHEDLRVPFLAEARAPHEVGHRIQELLDPAAAHTPH
ncbi:DUF2470 domain-containing protein [Streptomyces sp. NPDC052225]|uniref:DUF2470 domain-containing protein n=1 Tax=Streptomyces sp. NPDC052225 TaxID=3154949 RepID=UPI003423BD2A